MKFFLFIFFLLVFALTVSAQGVPEFLSPNSSSTIPGFLKGFYDFALIVAGVLAVGAIVVGGIMYSVSGAVDKKGLGKEIIAGALWGLLLLLGAYVILRTVNPKLVDLEAPVLPEVGFYQCSEENFKAGKLENIKIGGGMEIELPECEMGEWPINFETGTCKCYVDKQWITYYNEMDVNPEPEGTGVISCDLKRTDVGEIAAQNMINLGKTFQGKLTYKLGGDVIHGTADCSTFTGYLYECVMSVDNMAPTSKMFSMPLPSSLERKTGNDPNFFKNLKPGDLIGYSAACRCGGTKNCGHVMMVYEVDENGPTKVLEQGGFCSGKGSCISNLNSSKRNRKGSVLSKCGFMIHIKR